MQTAAVVHIRSYERAGWRPSPRPTPRTARRLAQVRVATLHILLVGIWGNVGTLSVVHLYLADLYRVVSLLNLIFMVLGAAFATPHVREEHRSIRTKW